MPEIIPFGVYVHWPFCQAKCPYCDFNSHVSAIIDQPRWRAALVREVGATADRTPGRVVRSIFFGGGTPSLMPPETVAAIIDAIRSAWSFANDVEITLEANPTSIETGRFRAYRDAGVNRVSVGIQALNDSDLRHLGRLHTAAEAMTALAIARDTFSRVSFDLIYARQHQTLADWRAELDLALSMAADHLSLYQLTVEPGTAFGDRHRRGRLAGLPSEDLSADMYELTQELCDAHARPAYEVSNHASPGAESRHNLIYWRAQDCAGIGPGAHGRLTLDGGRIATEAPKAPGAWLVAAENAGATIYSPISDDEDAAEALIMGLRVNEGVAITRLGALARTDPFQASLSDLIDQNLIVRTEDRIATTAQGRLILNALLRRLLD
ncbi:coproporphyrinogen III oxidase [Rhodobacteraceae bacterium CCMM004]|nr:coproporphyrinogen III oxidase [Rhodobacteraceae bacterium CCMM004]